MREQKESVRKILRQRKEAMIPEDRLRKSHRICRHLMKIIRDGETVMVFTSKEKEVNTKPLIMTLFEQGKPGCCPDYRQRRRAVSGSPIYGIFPHLSRARLAFLNPSGARFLQLRRILTRSSFRCSGLTVTGGRIGYGAGYYDRFLSKNQNLRKIGIAFACQEVDSLPVDENDIRMDYYHNRGWYCVSGRGSTRWRSTAPGYLTPLQRHSRSGSRGSSSRQQHRNGRTRQRLRRQDLRHPGSGAPARQGSNGASLLQETPDGRPGNFDPDLCR